MFFAAVMAGMAAEVPRENTGNLLRFGLTTRMFRGLNENDGRAALKVYIESVGKERGIVLKSMDTFDNVLGVGKALRNGQLDAASVTTEEYLRISDEVASGHVFDEPGRSDPGEEFLLLVHRGSAVTNLAGLRGGLLTEYDNLRTSLARMWLDVLLLEQGLPSAEGLFAKVTLERKLSTVVLPVFFGNAQACLVTRRGFDTMVELNPQVGKNLRVLAASPAFVVTVLCFGSMANPADKATTLEGIQRLHEQPRGQQLLTVFQGGERLIAYPVSVLDRARKLRLNYLRRTAQEKRAEPSAKRRKGRQMIARLMVMLALVARCFGSADETNRPPFRFAFSARMFSGVNENDAQAAVRGWAQGLAKERNINLDGQPIIHPSRAAIVEALRSKQVDCVSLTTDDYLALEPNLQNTNLLVSSIAGKTSEQYLLLVHVKSGISSPGELKGRSLVILDHVRASLAGIWLEVLLAQQGLALPSQHFSQVRSAPKLTGVVLPVFFRQQDACVVTRSGFDTMSELNPQLRVQLKPLAASMELVPAFTFLRPDYRGAPQDEIVAEVLKMHLTASGKQILTLFQADRIERCPAQVLDTARGLIAVHRELNPASGLAPRAGARSTPTTLLDGVWRPE